MAHLHRSYGRQSTTAAPAGGPATGPVETYANDTGSAAMSEEDAWFSRSRIMLTPVAAPSILGLFGFFAATIGVGSNIAGWWGGPTSGLTLFPFAMILGGVAQLLAGMWAYRARDGLATAMHGTWGSFWIGWGILQLLYATGVSTPTPLGTTDRAFAWWFIPLAAITISGALASLAESLGLFAVLSTLGAGSVVFAIGLYTGSLTTDHVAGWLYVISAACAWYVATAMMMLSTTGRTILPVGHFSKAANIPTAKPRRMIEFHAGEPGIRAGQ